MARDWLRMVWNGAAVVAALGLAAGAEAGPLTDSLKPGAVKLQSTGPITFGAEGVLFVGDPKAAAVYAIGTGDTASSKVAPVNIDNIGAKLAGMLGVKEADVQINDLAVNPASNKVYLSVSRGKGPAALPVILAIGNGGEIKEVALASVPHAKAELSKPVAEGAKRMEAITGLKVVKDKLFVAGLSNEEFASTLRAIPFPFQKVANGTSVEIYHGAHGKFETRSPIRTFVPFTVGKEPQLLAAYTCTPLVQFPVSELKPGAKIKGKTIAELGNRNRPLDMIVYQKDGKDYLLMANSSRGLMKITTEGIDKVEAIYAEEDLPKDQEVFTAFNAEQAMQTGYPFSSTKRMISRDFL